MDRELLTKEAYLKKLSRRSLNTARGHNTSINTFENWHKTTDFIIADEPLKILGSFVDFLESQDKSARTINTYLNQLKKYFRLCYGIKLDAEDFKDFVGLPQILDEELEPLEKHEEKHYANFEKNTGIFQYFQRILLSYMWKISGNH